MSLRHALLGLLSEGPASGYELKKTFDLSLANVWPANHSQIYPTLAKLADDELVTIGEEGARGRKEYTITDAGRAELRRWMLHEPPEPARRHEDLLRIFFYATLSDGEAAELLAHQIDRAKASGKFLEDLYRGIDWDDSPSDLYGALVLEQGRMWAKMRLDWATWALEQVHSGATATTLSDRLPDGTFD